MAVNDIYELAFVQQFEEYKPVNIIHYIETADGGTALDASTLANRFDSVNIPLWALSVTNDINFLCLIVRRIHPGPGHPFILSPLTNTMGALLGSPVGPQTQAVLRKYPGNDVTPFLVGRLNIAGTPEDGWTEGQMTTAQAALFSTLAAALQADLSSAGYTFSPVIWSPTRLKVPTPPFHVLWDTTIINFGQKVLTRRRSQYHSFAP